MNMGTSPKVALKLKKLNHCRIMWTKDSNKFQESIRSKQPRGAQPDHRSQARPSIPSNNRFEALESHDVETEGTMEEDPQQITPENKSEQPLKDQKK
jgi:hypothetical protein